MNEGALGKHLAKDADKTGLLRHVDLVAVFQVDGRRHRVDWIQLKGNAAAGLEALHAGQHQLLGGQLGLHGSGPVRIERILPGASSQ